MQWTAFFGTLGLSSGLNPDEMSSFMVATCNADSGCLIGGLDSVSSASVDNDFALSGGFVSIPVSLPSIGELVSSFSTGVHWLDNFTHCHSDRL